MEVLVGTVAVQYQPHIFVPEQKYAQGQEPDRPIDRIPAAVIALGVWTNMLEP